MEAKRRGEKIGGRKPTHTPEKVARAMQMLGKGDMTRLAVARAVDMSRSRMYGLVACARAEQEQAEAG
ncbi:helix-turn-helix domain-containing protein [Streptomyces sp. NPDC060035]|uniref:helix-turn-helix domain-containing protein n=1 Tax=Streptomyces sp. NPDC060035 TaxID=3347044 RepID=UPI0036B14824